MLRLVAVALVYVNPFDTVRRFPSDPFALANGDCAIHAMLVELSHLFVACSFGHCGIKLSTANVVIEGLSAMLVGNESRNLQR